jgi:hypothetical protein
MAGKVANRQPIPLAGHFYYAQLFHYAIKTGEAAKKQLLAVFGAKQTLSVLKKILRL